jgi:hypothetical protein
VRTYAIGVDNLLWHPANGDAHTLIAGEEGLTVLVAAEGSRTNITYLPRTKQFWLGPVWSPADSAHPYDADAELGPLEPPEPTRERPRVIFLAPAHPGQGRPPPIFRKPTPRRALVPRLMAGSEHHPVRAAMRAVHTRLGWRTWTRSNAFWLCWP